MTMQPIPDDMVTTSKIYVIVANANGPKIPQAHFNEAKRAKIYASSEMPRSSNKWNKWQRHMYMD